MKSLFDWFEQRSRLVIAMISLSLLAFVGFADYLTGYAILLSAFYLLPVGLAAWFVGGRFAAAVSLMSVLVSLATDIAAGAKYASLAVPIWNGAIGLLVYFVVAWTLVSLRSLQHELEQRVVQRTNALSAEIRERSRLEKEILEISEREQRRIGHDLHDSLSQHWVATSMAAQVLGEKLAARSLPEQEDAQAILRMAEDGAMLTRALARGISPIQIETAGLVVALRDLSVNTSRVFRVSCTFECESAPSVADAAAATHLLRICQEAINNAVRHGKPREIAVSLAYHRGCGELSIEDDGDGLPEEGQVGEGMGMRIMAHRAAMIGGELSVEPNPTGGTFVKCIFPAFPQATEAA
jgi:signal transduction histidine kinase